jgi:hypothetical protein
MLDKALEFACNLLELWQLMDYKGKVRLQKLVYPEGLIYDHKNGTLRTLEINPIFSTIHSLSKDNADGNCKAGGDETENLRQVYLTLPSSNFLWNSLDHLNIQIIDFQTNYQKVWEDVFVVYPSPATGYTEARVFRYTSSRTGGMPEFGPGEISKPGN